MSNWNRRFTCGLLCSVIVVLGAQSASALDHDVAATKAALKSDYNVTDAEFAQVEALASSASAVAALLGEYGTLRAGGLGHAQAIAAVAQRQAASAKAAAEEASRSFMGFKWGLGFGVSADLSSDDRVKSAEVVDGIVRVSNESSVLPRIVLEGHHFIFHNGSDEDITEATFGHGPFIAVQSSGEDLINGFGAGWMVGFRYKATSPSSFNLGLGAIVDANVQVLGDGLEPNEPLPGSETDIRFKEESRTGLLFFGSFSF